MDTSSSQVWTARAVPKAHNALSRTPPRWRRTAQKFLLSCCRSSGSKRASRPIAAAVPAVLCRAIAHSLHLELAHGGLVDRTPRALDRDSPVPFPMGLLCFLALHRIIPRALPQLLLFPLAPGLQTGSTDARKLMISTPPTVPADLI